MSTWIEFEMPPVFSLCGASYGEARPIDEPPGKLRALEFDCRDSTPHRLVVEIDYRPHFFSATRTWAEDRTRRQIVIAVRRRAKACIECCR